MLPAMASQPLVPACYVLFGWKDTLLAIVIVNFIWNLAFCTAVISLQLAAYSALWTKSKWISMLGFGVYFACRRDWTLLTLTLGTPVILFLLGQLIVRRPTATIQEFMLLTLGLENRHPSSRVQSFLDRIESR